MKRATLLLIGTCLFALGFIMFLGMRRVAVVVVEDKLLRTAVPIGDFDESIATKVDAWSRRDLELHRNSKTFRLNVKECFVTLCGDAREVRFFKIHTSALTHEQLTSLHLKFCDFFDSPEQVNQFNEWSASDRSVLVSMNKFFGRCTYHFSVHRTYDEGSPWFASIVVAWSCDKTIEGGSGMGGMGIGTGA